LTPDVLSTTLHDSNFGGPLPVKIQSFTSPPRLTSLRAQDGPLASGIANQIVMVVTPIATAQVGFPAAFVA